MEGLNKIIAVNFKGTTKNAKKIEINFKKAGPPRCPECNSIMEMWVKKWNLNNDVIRKEFLWICPNYCNIRSFAQKEKI